MSDATGDQAYQARAEKWFRVMKSRLKAQDDGTFRIWNHWEPGGAWDYQPNGDPKHWVGLHPKISEVDGVLAAYEHGLIFTADDIARLVKTALVNGRNWPALAPYDHTLQTRSEQSIRPEGWSELTIVPWYLSLQRQRSVGFVR